MIDTSELVRARTARARLYDALEPYGIEAGPIRAREFGDRRGVFLDVEACEKLATVLAGRADLVTLPGCPGCEGSGDGGGDVHPYGSTTAYEPMACEPCLGTGIDFARAPGVRDAIRGAFEEGVEWARDRALGAGLMGPEDREALDAAARAYVGEA